MRKFLLLYIVFCFTMLSACKHDVVTVPGDGSVLQPTGPGVIAVADTSKGYQPVTKDTYYKYSVAINGTTTDEVINTMFGNTTTINGKLYSIISERVASSHSVSFAYQSIINHDYTFRENTNSQGSVTELLYLKDDQPVGFTWTAPFTDSGTLNSAPAQMKGTIIEKGITKTVFGNIFSKVIHTSIQLQQNIGNGFSSYATYDFYTAQGIGIIEIDGVLGFPGVPNVNITELLTDYSIQ